MSALVADYGSSSSEEEEEPEPDLVSSCTSATSSATSEQTDVSSHGSRPSDDLCRTKKQKCEQLPLPSFLDGAGKELSLFANPFRLSEAADSAVLERHVKLTQAPDELRCINGRKICWNYRKGRCRFGHKCSFAHDSDVQLERSHSAHSDREASSNVANSEASDTAPVGKTNNNNSSEREQSRKKRPASSNSTKFSKKPTKTYIIEKGQLK